MADVVFVYPKTGFDLKHVSIEFPLSAIHASSMLDKRGYKIKIIDQRNDAEWKETLKKELKKNPIYAGISSMTGTQIYYGLQAAKVVRENSDVKIVWGGVHASILPVETVENEFVDIVVKGDGERTALHLAEAMEKGKKLDNIKGICYKNPKTKKITNNPEPEPEDMDNFPDVPYHLINVREYLKNNGGLFSAVYSKGCPFGCGFCCNPLLSKRKWRTFSTNRIVDDLEYNYGKYHFKKLKFNDENFFVAFDRIDKISDAINDRYEWECQARIDSAARFDFNLLRKRGLYQIQPGIESGNDRILKLINKGLDKKRILDYNKSLSKTGVIATYNFMMGFPTETVKEMQDSVSLALRLVKENPLAEISGFYIYVPYPGCDLYNLAIQKGFIPPERLDDWALFNRQQLYTPWIQKRLDFLKNIAITSRFVDGRRMARIFENTWLPNFMPKILSKMYQRRWEKKDFKNHLDVKLIEFTTSKIVKVF